MPSFRNTIKGLTRAPTSRRDGAPRSAARLFGSAISSGSGPFSARVAKRHLTAYAGSQAIDLVYGCSNVIAQTTSAAGYKLQTADGRPKPLDRSEAEDGAHVAPLELVDLLKKPNPWQTWDSLIEELVIDYIVTGDFFVYKYGVENADGVVPGERPLALYRLAPDRVTVLSGEERGRPAELIGGYKYEVPGAEGEPVTYDPEDVIHLRAPNVHSPYRGAGVIAGSPKLFDLELALTTSKESYFRNGARLGGVLESDRSVPDNLISKLKREFNGLFAGADSAGKTAVLSAGVKYRAIQSNAQESELTAITEQTAKRVIALFRVPRSKLGMEPGDDPAEERREFANGMMRPLLNRIQTVFTERLTMPGWGLKFVIDYEYQMPVEEQIKLAGTYGTLPGVTIREVREKAGLPRLVDLMPDAVEEATEIELIVLNLPGQEASTENLPGEPGRPPRAEKKSGKVPAGVDAAADRKIEQRGNAAAA